jgi:ribosome-binding ATPase YchF (GTP1/OBG family)
MPKPLNTYTLSNVKIKKLNLKFKYLTLEHQEVMEEYQQHKRAWEQAIYSLEQTLETEIFQRNEKKVEKSLPSANQQVKALSGDDAEVVKTLYRQVAKEVHPDTNPGDTQCDRMMKRANRAYKCENLADLIDLCVDLDLEMVGLSASHYHMIEKNISTMENEINNVKKTDAWIYGTADDNQRDIILKKVEELIEKQ